MGDARDVVVRVHHHACTRSGKLLGELMMQETENTEAIADRNSGQSIEYRNETPINQKHVESTKMHINPTAIRPTAIKRNDKARQKHTKRRYNKKTL